MKKILITAVVLVLGIGAVAYAMSEIKEPEPKTYSWRYKLTVEIDTPEGLKSGSAVREVSVVYTPKSSTRAKPHRKISIKGEAVVIDLGDQRKVFSLLVGGRWGVDQPSRIFYDIFPVSFPAQSIEGLEYYSQLKDKKVVLDEDHYSSMVMFEDINDQMTVKRVYGRTRTTVDDQFEERFGKDYRIKQVIIETTDEEVTWKVAEIIPWVLQLNDRLLDGRNVHTIDAENSLANSLGKGSFTVGGNYGR
ncbi:MAG: hypothetical protein KZQ89_02995 [Candidatus Thiodiazotropha sp. (ex Lucinoma kastoroae)]|nr:hypothetical protein [Candidatus Thiodiazotropha sp. (ex Lucinoma kastoroae)]